VTLLRIVAAVVVIALWTALFGKYLLVPGTPQPPAELSGIMLAVVTWLFAGAAKNAGDGSSSRDLRRLLARWLLKDGKDRDEA
jgi:hypothetical protein